MSNKKDLKEADVKAVEEVKADLVEAKVTKEFTVTSYNKDGDGKLKPSIKTYKVDDTYSGPKSSVDSLVAQKKVKL